MSPCYAYRGLREHETVEEYVQRLAGELENEILRLGPKNVAGLVLEPVVGAALGCVPALPGYLEAMKAVCKRHGVLFILDEIMCGMGRTGFVHAWQAADVVPDIQVIGKGLAGGYADISGLLCSSEIFDAFGQGKTAFQHGHTFQNSPANCAAALAVQKVIQEEALLHNTRKMGDLLSQMLLSRLLSHRYVGDIRGQGLFWGIEFVTDKVTKATFPASQGVAAAMHEKGLTPDYGLYVYAGSGMVDGKSGDHLMLAPALNITAEEVEMLVERLVHLVEDYFEEYDGSASVGGSG